MSTTSNLTITDAANLVSDFKTTRTSHATTDKKAAETFSADKRGRLDERLAKAYGISVSLLGMEAAEFGKFCVQQGTFAPGEDENPFSACVRILFGTKKDGKIVPDKSAWKYGKCFRAAQSLGWTAEDFAEQLGTYKLPVMDKDGKEKKLGRLIALETLDTRNNGDPESQQAEWERKAAMNWLNRIPPALALVDDYIPGYVEPENGMMLGVVIQWNKFGGKWNVRGVHTDNQDKAFNLIGGEVMTEFRNWLADKRLREQMAELAEAPPEDIDALLAALEQQNREVRSAEIEHKLAANLNSGAVTVEGMPAPVIDSQAA